MHPECPSALRGTGKRPATGRLESTILKSAGGPGPPSSPCDSVSAQPHARAAARPRGQLETPVPNPGPAKIAGPPRIEPSLRTNPGPANTAPARQPDLPAPGRSARPNWRWAPGGSIRSSTGPASACPGGTPVAGGERRRAPADVPALDDWVATATPTGKRT